MAAEEPEVRRAFVTCAARSVAAVERLLADVETTLLDAGWRTRVPARLEARTGIGYADRRRLRLETYRELERCHLLVHVASPAALDGTRLHREVARAVLIGLPVLIVAAPADRARLGVGSPSRERLDWLVAATKGHLVPSVAQLPELARVHARTGDDGHPR